MRFVATNGVKMAKLFDAGDSEIDLRFYKFIGLTRPYINSFKRSADIVAATVPMKNPGIDSELLFAVVYNYRHAIELQLKYIINLGLECDLIKERPDCLDDHKLYPLWNKALLVLKDDYKPTELKKIGSIIQQLHNADRSGQEFRYQRRTDKKQSLESLPAGVSFKTVTESLKFVTDRLDAYLDGLEAWWDDLRYNGQP